MTTTSKKLILRAREYLRKDKNLPRKIIVVRYFSETKIYEKDFVRKIYESAQDKLKSIINDISAELNEVLPLISLEIRSHYYPNVPLDECTLPKTKIIVQEEGRNTILPCACHAVQVIVVKDSNEAGISYAPEQMTSIRIHNNRDVIELICDIFLDSVLLHFHTSNLCTPNEYFKVKQEFINNKIIGNHSYWGKIISTPANLPLGASIFTRPEKFIPSYIDLWNDFCSKFKICGDQHLSEHSFQNFTKIGEMSRKKLLRQLKQLPPVPGKYLLIGTNHRPRNRKKREVITSFFTSNGSSWHKNLIMIVPFSEGAKYIKYAPYLFFFYFKLTADGRVK